MWLDNKINLQCRIEYHVCERKFSVWTMRFSFCINVPINISIESNIYFNPLVNGISYYDLFSRERYLSFVTIHYY